MRTPQKHTNLSGLLLSAKTIATGAASFILCFLASALPASAESKYSYSLYGTPGLIDMPTAQSAKDAELSVTVSRFEGQARTTLNFQVTPRLSASFRYATIDNYTPTGESISDRSFDFRYRLLDEGRYRPAVAIGLRDFMGTGPYSGEYVVATKTIGDRLSVTGGLGWGRLGSYNGFSNPLAVFGDSFDTRSGFSTLGGEPNYKSWFRGDAALFAGVSWAAGDRLAFKAEYSSDGYAHESTVGLVSDRLTHRTPLNFGVNYQIRPNMNLSASYLYGSVLAVGLNVTLNPRHKSMGSGLDPTPIPVKSRPARHISPKDWGTGWVGDSQREDAIRTTLTKILAAEGIDLIALELTGNTARVQIHNKRYDATPQAIGRTARVLTQILPASVEVFRIEPVIKGMTPNSVTLRRTGIESLEHTSDGGQITYSRAEIDTVLPSNRMEPQTGLYPDLSWGLSPFSERIFSDPGSPLRAHLGVELSGRYEISPSLSISGVIQQPLIGDLGTDSVSDSVIQHVRSDENIYANADGPLIKRLTLDHYFRPTSNLYGRISAGYLERMYGGISGELLWKPVDSRFGLGLEMNYAKQRDFDQQFGFQDYSVTTGHVSAYYEFGNGFHGQVDVGKYLAGDLGVTVALDREFKNGWKVGAFATLTDVPFSDFGKGSFDKGIRFTIPLSWSSGRPTQRVTNTVIRPSTRDGGARLGIEGRLYDLVRGFHDTGLKNRWGRFWR